MLLDQSEWFVICLAAFDHHCGQRRCGANALCNAGGLGPIGVRAGLHAQQVAVAENRQQRREPRQVTRQPLVQPVGAIALPEGAQLDPEAA